MSWVKRKELEQFLARRDYDIRKSQNARWIDQKCSIDVLRAVADCIVTYSEQAEKLPFSAADIWYSPYTSELVRSSFKKPGTGEPWARNEYDKFFSQPLELLAYAGILNKVKLGSRNFYEVAEPDILDFISLSERNSLLFLELYISKVLSDSGIYPLFEEFFNKQTPESYDEVKEGFARFTIDNTNINTAVECNRIFIKVLNPLSFVLDKRGTEQGRISDDVITQEKLLYNNKNFRDILSGKRKGITRREHEGSLPIEPESVKFDSNRAKRAIRQHNDAFRHGKSEILNDGHSADRAIHAHHIFPESRFPEIAAYYENLIALTPTQHMSYAHPDGHTQKIDRDYQRKSILAKIETIKSAQLDPEQNIYSFGCLAEVLAIGLANDSFLSVPDGDFESLAMLIEKAYDK